MNNLILDSLIKEIDGFIEGMGLHIRQVPSERRYWFIRTQGGSYFDEFFFGWLCRYRLRGCPLLGGGERTEEIIGKVKENHQQAQRALNHIYKFCKEIKRGDMVIMPSASSAHFAFGYIESDEILRSQRLRRRHL